MCDSLHKVMYNVRKILTVFFRNRGARRYKPKTSNAKSFGMPKTNTKSLGGVMLSILVRIICLI